MKNDFIWFVLALLTGALIPIQAATNSLFSKSIGSATYTGLMVFVVGIVGMIIFLLINRASMPGLQQLRSAPPAGYMGGLIVATYVIMITVLVPRIGVGPAIGLIVTGQIICSITIDHFGLFQVPVQIISLKRLI